MKAKKFLKNNLSAVLCAAMLFNPVLPACYAVDDLPVAENENVNEEDVHTIELNFLDGNDEKPYTGLQFDLYAVIINKANDHSMNINCGNYDTGENSSIKIELPSIILDTFSDESKYEIYFDVRSTNIHADCIFLDSDGIEYKGANEASYNIMVDYYGRGVTITSGSLTLTPPKKLVYKVGEELDLTGGSTYGCGVMYDSITKSDRGVWDDFGSKLTMSRVDSTDFDNSKPGEYVIKFAVPNKLSDTYHVTVKPSEFTVTVEDSDRVEGATSKISIVDDENGRVIKNVKVTLFETENRNGRIAPDKDNIIAMWDTSKNPERLFTETEFDPKKRYYLGFNNIPEKYAESFDLYSNGYDFIEDDIFSFEKEDDNAEWTIRVKAKEPVIETPKNVEFRMYSRFAGKRNTKKDIGFAEIKDSDGNSLGLYPIDRSATLPDGDYSATITVCSKDFDCFSNKTVDFTVKDGQTDKFIDYEIEKQNFDKVGNGDSNNDKKVDMADIVIIMQSLANPDKYGVNGTDSNHITADGCLCADIDENGVTNTDALTIQKYLLGYYNI